MKRVLFLISLLCLFVFVDNVFANETTSVNRNGDVVEIKDENGNFYSVNTKENTVLYNNEVSKYEVIIDEKTIEVNYKGCTYFKNYKDNVTVGGIVVEECPIGDDYDLDTANSLMWAVEEANKVDFSKNIEEKDSKNNTFWVIVTIMFITAMMVFVFFSDEDIDITE